MVEVVEVGEGGGDTRVMACGVARSCAIGDGNACGSCRNGGQAGVAQCLCALKTGVSFSILHRGRFLQPAMIGIRQQL